MAKKKFVISNTQTFLDLFKPNHLIENAVIENVYITDTELSSGTFNNVHFKDVVMRNCDLRFATLHNCKITEIDLRECKLYSLSILNSVIDTPRSLHIAGSIVDGINLSGTTGLLSASKFLEKNFKSTKDGIIVYKALHSGRTDFDPNPKWNIRAGRFITETVNMNRFDTCGCGINFATLTWVKNNYITANIWECLIQWKDLADVCVPYNTDGKARCGRLKLLRKVVSKN